MTETAAVFLLTAGLLAAALWRRPEAITLTLAVAFGMAMIVAEWWPRETRLPVVIALDAGVVAASGFIARHYHSERARIIMAIGLFKVTFAIAAVSFGMVQHLRAAGLNTAFIAQVLVAGGIANGVLSWLGNRVDRLRGLRNRMLGNVGS